MILNPSKPVTTENSIAPLTSGSKKISKISVNDLHDTSRNEKGLSKTETQHGAVGVATDRDSLDGQEKTNESPRLKAMDPISEAKSPETIQTKTNEGGVAVGRLGRFNTILLPNSAISNKV